jgi:NAD(P)-dependent dehydrogenase (short-subunit alcohol dehydrogenase family)
MARTRIRGKTALVTGAAKRIGRATALALADEGSNVVVHYNSSPEEADELARELRAKGVNSWTVRADFEKPEEYETLIQRAFDIAGSLDILVNNASIFPVDKIEDVQFDSVVSNVRINAWVPFVLSRAFAHTLGHGKIVNMVDSRVTGYDWSHVAYIWSKHMLAAITRMIALDFAPNITVNAVAPGLILPPPGKDMSYLERLKDTVPLKRYGDPEDIADAIVFLLESDFITGEVIYVDGGRHLKEFTNG